MYLTRNGCKVVYGVLYISSEVDGGDGDVRLENDNKAVRNDSSVRKLQTLIMNLVFC
jgi:hypothetical protein